MKFFPNPIHQITNKKTDTRGSFGQNQIDFFLLSVENENV
ncbi:hypothetical protein B4096_1684 [Heyndrickxia coagulans]|uniref:Uncharacterized protein n=1 Tax=Heyndrickxia coagulans TaxID=1398 RepID=A0A133KL38_HEYCO|nr:hypothetical protein HMPREF3213_02309 [Heyndrickxia coagulans]KYC88369.1 hypothetical protein B4096_1684 [Heyndrickxia coagulans]